MARFGKDFVRGATQPAYLEGLFQLGQQVGSAPRRRREENERRETQETLAEMINTNTRIAETGNLKGLEEQRTLLTGMLSNVKGDESRDMILGELNRFEALRNVAKPVARQRDINTLIRSEQTLQEINDVVESLQGATTTEDRIKEATAREAQRVIKDRIASLKSDPALMIAVDNELIDREIASLTKDEALRSARQNDMLARLRSTPPNSAEWKDLVAEAEEKGLGQAVNTAIEEINAAELKRLEVAKAQEEQRPLSKEEIAELEEAGVPLPKGLSVIERRRRYTVFANSQIEKAVNKATRPLDVPSEARAKALVKTTLNFMVRDANLGFSPFTADLSEKVEDLLADPEEMETLNGLVADLTGSEIVDAVKGYIKDKFPEKYSDYEQALKNRKVEAEEFQDLLDEVYSEDSSLDRDDPTGVDQELARIRADRKLRDAVVRASSSTIEQGRGRRGGPM